MTRMLRVADTGVRPSRWNISMTAALAEMHRVGRIPDTIRFHRYPRSVLVGRQQSLAQEVDVVRCRQGGVEIARRVTGGGAVYMSPGILAWDVVAGRDRFGSTLAEVSSGISAIVAGGLCRLGVRAMTARPGDIEIGGQKVSGSGGAFEGRTIILQGSLLIDFDREEMASVLKARARGLAPAARVASLADFLGRVPSIEEIKAAIMAELPGTWRASIVDGVLRSEELAIAEKLFAEEIGTDEFVNGQATEATPHVLNEDRRLERAFS